MYNKNRLVVIILIVVLILLFYSRIETFYRYNPTIDRIYVIYIDSDKHRVKTFKNTTGNIIGNNQDYKNKFIYFKGTKGSELNVNTLIKYNQVDKKYKSYLGGKISKFPNEQIHKELGIYMSHLNIWKDAYINMYKYCLIFEIDAIIISNFIQKLKYILNKAPNDFDILFLGHCFEEKGKNINKNIYHSVKPHCTHCYILSQKGLKKLLKYAIPMRNAVDEFMAKLISHNLLISYSIHPPISKQEWN